MEAKMEPALTMKDVWLAADAILSPLGKGSAENFSQVRKKISGVQAINDQSLSKETLMAGKIASLVIPATSTRFEAMCSEVIQTLTREIQLPSERTLFILSTTKGNIDFLDEDKPHHPHIHLHTSSDFLAKKFGFKNTLVISNACISGVMALTVAARFLRSGQYDHAVVVGADTLNHFVVSGFQSLQALSDEPCKPFDVNRKGINLGEAAAAILLTTEPEALQLKPSVKFLGSGLSNDANHISGPSRTGEELFFAIRQALTEAGVSADEIDFISAHGTATQYNDEMEAKAFNLAGMGNVPLHSLKGYFGHTLGAAGILETVISTHSLLNNELVASLGYERSGVSQAVNVIRQLESKPLKTFLKTASGFGGCNAAAVFQKVN